MFGKLGMTLLAGGLGLVFAVVPMHVSPQQAHAAIVPGLPDPVNMLPSVVKAAAKAGAAPGNWDVIAALLYKGIVDTHTANAAKAVKAGVATVTEAQLLAKYASKFAGLPATALGGLVKRFGPAGLALTAVDIGLWIGTGAATIGGLNMSNDTLCKAGDSGWNLAAEIANGADCSSFYAPDPKFVSQANVDITEKPDGWTEYPANLVPQPWGLRGEGQAIVKAKEFRFKNSTYLSKDWEASSTWVAEGMCRGGTDLYTATVNIGFRDSRNLALFDYVGDGLAQDALGGRGLGVKCLDEVVGGWIGLEKYRQMFPKLERFKYAVFDHLRLTTSGANNTSRDIYYYPPGHELYKPGVEANPERWLECRVFPTSGAMVSARSMSFRETDSKIPSPNCPQLGKGLTLDRTEVWEMGGAQEHMLWDQKVTPEFDAVRKNMADCLDGSCILEVVKKDTTTCTSDPASCADWHEDPKREENYTCKWGQHVVNLKECNVLAPYYKPGAKTGGAPLGHPDTGKPIPNPSGRAPIGDPVKDPATKRDCFPSGWGILNPVEWVLKPVGCALESAFVPRQSVLDQHTRAMSAAWNATTVGQTARAISAWDFRPPGSSCNGFMVDVFFLGPPFRVLNACPGEVFASMASWSRIFGNISITVLGAVAVTRHLSRIVGYGGLGDDS